MLLENVKMEDDFYLNLMTWHRHAGIVTGQSERVVINTMIRDDDDDDASGYKLGEEEIVFELTQPVSAVAGIEDAFSQVAVGDRKGRLTLLDYDHMKAVRSINAHCSRIGVMHYNEHSHVMASGSRDSKVSVIDIRQSRPVAVLNSLHRQEVCGLRWSESGTMLATGGNDNLLCVVDVRMMDGSLHNQHHQYLARVENAHSAAIKAVCWMGDTLVTGGGTSDRRITAWSTQHSTTNTTTTSTTSNSSTNNDKWALEKAWSVLTPSQVCCLFTSPISTNTIVSTHGFTDNLIMSWDCRQLARHYHHHNNNNNTTIGNNNSSNIGNLNGTQQSMSMCEPKWSATGHKARVLYGGVSPCGKVVATASGDGTVRLWECFQESQKALHRRLLESKYL